MCGRLVNLSCPILSFSCLLISIFRNVKWGFAVVIVVVVVVFSVFAFSLLHFVLFSSSSFSSSSY